MRIRKESATLTILALLLSLFIFWSPAYSASGPLIWSNDNQLTFDPVEHYSEWNPWNRKWTNWTEVITDFDGLPSVASTNNNRIWLTWDQEVHIDDSKNNEIFYKIRDNSWSNDTRLTDEPNQDWAPAVLQTSDNKIWIFWFSNRTGNNEIFFKTTVDNGNSWSIDTQVTNDARKDESPAVCQTNDGRLWLVWSRVISSTDEEIIYKTFDGTAWSSETQLTYNPSLEEMPTIMQTSDGKIWVFWGQYIPANDEWEIYYKTSTNNGASWSSEASLTVADANDDLDPTAFQAQNGTIWTFWARTRQAQSATYDIYYKTSADSGASWSSAFQFTTDPADDYWPTATQNKDKSIWIVWTSTRPDPVYGIDNVDLYVKASLLGDVGSVGDPRVPDGYIDITDLNIISRALTTTPSSPPGTGWNQWNPDCDFTLDNLIDVDDLYIAGKNFGHNAFGA